MERCRQLAQRSAELAARLIETGRAVGPLMPWHHSADPYHWLIAESLLRRTTRTAAHKAFLSLIADYPDWPSLLSASETDIRQRIAWVGLGAQRSKQFKALAHSIQVLHAGTVPRLREELLTLPGVGLYIADAVRLYAFEQTAFPIDPNVQRVYRRVMRLPTPRGTRHTDPYRDPHTLSFAAYLVNNFSTQELQDAHRGLLHIAWTTCRPIPACEYCPLGLTCAYANDFLTPVLSATSCG